MNDWKEYKLGELCDVRDGTHDSPKEVKIGKKLVTSKHIKNGKIDFSLAYNISVEDYENVNKRSKVDKYDILFSMIGTIAETVIVSFEPDFAIKNVGLFKTMRDKELAEWIYYFLKSNESKAEINASLKGSTQQYITLGDLRNFPIKVPPLPEQKAIAEVLSSLDDKIDLLHRQNETLEKMAETLFRQWFIEEAKDDWEVCKLGDLITISSGKGVKKEKFLENGEYPILGANGEIGRINEFLINDTIIYTGRVGTLGNIFRVEEQKVWLSDNTLIIKPLNYYNFIYFLLKIIKLEEYNVGSTQPLIRQTDIINIEVKLPNKEKLTSFENQTSLIYIKINRNKEQIQTLTKLRDTLLPKLMSGEVRVNYN